MNIRRYVTSLITRVFVTVKLADVGGRNAGYFGARKFSKMFTTQAIFGVWCMVGAVCSGAMKFLEKRVALSVREILYEELTDRCVSVLHCLTPSVALSSTGDEYKLE